MSKATDADPVDLAARALRHRDRSRRQLDDRLAKAGVDEEARADALETLERVGYVDDTRFAAARADSLAGRGFGDEAIRELLAGDGVGPEAVEAALAGLESEADRARALAERLGRTPKAAAQLQRKGFGPDAVEAAFGSLFAEGDAGA
ncbi:MAG TPA: RecX family transcriptional regulator [Gaiellaceae bacterium]|nr:RecX family transcriptional regulator [Gaiellaceae bacterium]